MLWWGKRPVCSGREMSEREMSESRNPRYLLSTSFRILLILFPPFRVAVRYGPSLQRRSQGWAWGGLSPPPKRNPSLPKRVLAHEVLGLSLMKVPAAGKCAVLISRHSPVFQAERSAL